jgi:GNAT superfamily N-acetyltransferase
MDVVVRRAGPGDIDEVVRQRLTFLAHIRDDDVGADGGFISATRRFIEDEVAAGRMHSWLAEDGGQCVGIVSMLLWSRPPRPHDRGTLDAYIINMYVVPEHRGNGIGRHLLDACLTAAEEFGIGRLFLHATDEGRPLYESAGFRANPNWLERRGGPSLRPV